MLHSTPVRWFPPTPVKYGGSFNGAGRAGIRRGNGRSRLDRINPDTGVPSYGAGTMNRIVFSAFSKKGRNKKSVKFRESCLVKKHGFCRRRRIAFSRLHPRPPRLKAKPMAGRRKVRKQQTNPNNPVNPV